MQRYKIAVAFLKSMNKDGIVKLIINLYAIQRVCKRVRARAKITEGAKVCFYKVFIKLFLLLTVLTYC